MTEVALSHSDVSLRVRDFWEGEGFLGGWERAGLGGDSGDYLEVFFGSGEGGDF